MFFLQTKEQNELDYQSSIELAAERAAGKAAEANTEKIVRNLVKLSGLTNEQIAGAAEVSVQYVARIREELTGRI